MHAITVGAALLAAGCATHTRAQSLASDSIIFVTDINDISGNIGLYTGGPDVTWIAAACPAAFHDVSLFNNQILLASSRTQIFSRSLSTSFGCGTPIISSVNENYLISHVATDGSTVYFTEEYTACVRAVPLSGGDDRCLIANGADGVLGERIGLTVVDGTLVYAVRGVNASSPTTPLNGLIQVGADGSNPTILFSYDPSQAWWMTDIVVSSAQAAFLGAEFRNDSSGPSNNIQQSTWPLGNIEPIFTGIQPADEDNTYLTYDDGPQDMAWFTVAETNQLNAVNASGRYIMPMLLPFFAVPAENGTVHGVAFARGSTQFDYCSSPLSPCGDAGGR